MFYSLACRFLLLFETETTTRHNPVPRTSELAFGLYLNPRANGERSWQQGTTRNSARMWRRVQESNPGHFDGNQRSALSSLPQLLFAFCEFSFLFVEFKFSAKESSLSFRECKISSKESSLRFKRINFVPSESSLQRIPYYRKLTLHEIKVLEINAT